MSKMKIWSLCFLFSTLLREGFSAKILVITAMCTGSEESFFAPIIGGLALKGHQVTSVTSKISQNVPSNVTQLQPLDYNVLFGDYDNPFRMVENNEDLSILFYDLSWFTNFCSRVYENREFQKKVLHEKFDVILSTAMFHQCFYGLVPKNQAHFILLAALPPANYLLHGLGTHFPPSFIPYPTLPYTDQMIFLQRVHNFLSDFALEFLWEFSYTDQMERVYRKYLGGSENSEEGENLPGIREIRKNISLFLTNSFVTMNFPRPLLPDVVEVGGVHCTPGKPLTAELENFVSGSPEGFIYFSMGSIAKGKHMPIEIRDMFIRVFSKLKVRVLWKWETDEDLPGRPPNVRISKWFPQKDILGHPKIRFFMTHGGLFSAQEALYNGVPLIGVPVYFDQFLNMKQAVKYGYGLNLDIYNLKEEDLQWAVNQMLTNSTYKTKASIMSGIFRDQQQTPLERAIYWIEYVIRHNGAPHLRSAARDLYWFQYHSLDIIFCLVVTICTFLTIFICVLRRICQSLCYFTSKAKPVSLDRKRQ